MSTFEVTRFVMRNALLVMSVVRLVIKPSWTVFDATRLSIRMTSEGVVPPVSAAHSGIPDAETFKTCPAVAPNVRVCNVLSADAYMRSPCVTEVILEEFEIIPLVSRSVIRVPSNMSGVLNI